MSGNALSADEFDRMARLHFKGWSERSLSVVRSLLVDSKGLKDVASQFGMKPQQANVLRARFLTRIKEKAQVKVPAAEFMQTVTPSNASPLDPFKDDLKQLAAHGYSPEQIKTYLARNDVQVSDRDLTDFLRAIQ